MSPHDPRASGYAGLFTLAFTGLVVGQIGSILGDRLHSIALIELLTTENGAMGAVDLSWSIHKERDAFVEIFGPEGVLSIGWKGSKYRQSEKLDWVTFGEGYDKMSAFTNQFRNFHGAIQGREAPVITAEDSLESVRVIEAACRSLEVDGWIEVPRDPSARLTGA